MSLPVDNQFEINYYRRAYVIAYRTGSLLKMSQRDFVKNFSDLDLARCVTGMVPFKNKNFLSSFEVSMKKKKKP